MLPVFSQKTVPHDLYISVIDAFTHQPIPIDKVNKAEILHPDSTLFMTVKFTAVKNNRTGLRRTCANTLIEKQPTNKFILKLSAKGYATKYINLNLYWRKRNVSFTNLIDIPLRRLTISETEQILGEAQVVATKIKFYTNGDTLVYNPDAFQLQEGSMLDGIISQLPGVELKPNGQILVNGKVVESLLLNGRDFFKGENTILLDNLPAYMVKNIQIYHKESDTSRHLGHKVDEGELVMDIKLKRQYSIGWIANTEWGGGTEDRYLGRLFALRFTPQSRLSFFGNLNNVNDRRKPNGNGGWGDFDPSGGLTTTKRGGLDYGVYDKRDRFTLEGNVSTSYIENNLQWDGNGIDFLPGGDVHNVSSNHKQSDNFSISTSHNFKMQHPITGLGYSFAPRFSYSRTDNQSNYLNGSFNMKPDKNYAEVLDSLFSPNWTKTVRNLVRRNGEQAKGKTTEKSAGLEYWSFIRLPRTLNGFSIDGDLAYNYDKSDIFNHFVHNYYQNQQMEEDFRNRYDYRHHETFKVSSRFKFFWNWNQEMFLNPSYTFTYFKENGNQSFYRLDFLDESAGQPLGWLPSQMENMLQALDEDNTNESTLNRFMHKITLDWQWNHTQKDQNNKPLSSWYVTIRPELLYQINRFDYRNAFKPQRINRDYWLPQFYFDFTRNTKGYKHELKMKLSISTLAPALTNMLDRTFTANPLAVTVGNPGLKKQTNYYVNFDYRSNKWLQQKERLLSGYVGWLYSTNAVAASRFFDRQTGITTTKSVNVNGNWQAWSNLHFTTPLDKKRKIILTANSFAQYYHTVDYASAQTEVNPVRTTTTAFLTGETLNINYRYKKVNLGIKGNMTYTHQNSTLENFVSPNTWSIHYGASAVIDLPWKFQLSTDLTQFSRRGYESANMNRDDLVWNARLSKNFLNNRLTVMVDAWDILGNLSNVSTGMNQQGSWELYSNVIPRYAMLRVVYKINKQPKKKK